MRYSNADGRDSYTLYVHLGLFLMGSETLYLWHISLDCEVMKIGNL